MGKIKVVIADDEYRICELIRRLIDWPALSMEIVALANDGIEALRIVREYMPDILITDIRMPGLSGLELIEQVSKVNPQIGFIVISGFSEFEYAKKAISFGVVDYLLKPVNRDELYASLKKFRDVYESRREESLRVAELDRRTKQDELAVRQELFADLQNRIIPEDIAAVCSRYHYHFQPDDYLQIIEIRADSAVTMDGVDDAFIFQKISQILQFEFEGLVSDLEGRAEKNGTFSFLFGYALDPAVVMKQYRRAFSRIMLQRDILKQVDFCMGIGGVCKRTDKLYISFSQARLAVQQRIVAGANHIIEGEKLADRKDGYPQVFSAFLPKMEHTVEMLKEEELKDLLRRFCERIKEDTSITGHDIIQMAKGMVNAFFLNLEKNGYHDPLREETFEHMTESVGTYASVDAIFLFLSQEMSKYIRTVKENRYQEGIRPVRDVKQFIREHISENISLDQISAMTGYNPAYYSTLFKKETGMTVSDYIIMSRMEMAKGLLRTTDDSIVEVCEKVGYSDMKTFIRNFKKTTGMKPSEYRKVYG